MKLIALFLLLLITPHLCASTQLEDFFSDPLEQKEDLEDQEEEWGAPLTLDESVSIPDEVTSLEKDLLLDDQFFWDQSEVIQTEFEGSDKEDPEEGLTDGDEDETPKEKKLFKPSRITALDF